MVRCTPSPSPGHIRQARQKLKQNEAIITHYPPVVYNNIQYEQEGNQLSSRHSQESNFSELLIVPHSDTKS